MLMDVANKFRECRFYDMAIDMLDKAKELYQRNYDFDSMAIPLEKQVSIYKTMSQDKRVEHATYFRLSFIGNGHIDEYRNKQFIYRAKANKLISGIEDKLHKRFDPDLLFIEDQWPAQEQINSREAKYCHIIKVQPLTFNEVDNFQLLGLEDEQLVFDMQDKNLKEQVKNMPPKMQNFHLQNGKNKFYSMQAIRIEGVDSLLFDQELQVFVVEKKFPCMTAMQQVTVVKKRVISCVRQAIRAIQETDLALTQAKNNVIQQAIDEWNVQLLHTALRKTLIAEINGGFKRYIQSFFTQESLDI